MRGAREGRQSRCQRRKRGTIYKSLPAVKTLGASLPPQDELLNDPLQPVAISRKSIGPANRKNKPNPLTPGCQQLPETFHGKGRVDATSLLLRGGHLPRSAAASQGSCPSTEERERRLP